MAGAKTIAAGEAEVGVALAEAVTALDGMKPDETARQRQAVRRTLYSTPKATRG
jgi:hypothetical protein